MKEVNGQKLLSELGKLDVFRCQETGGFCRRHEGDNPSIVNTAEVLILLALDRQSHKKRIKKASGFLTKTLNKFLLSTKEYQIKRLRYYTFGLRGLLAAGFQKDDPLILKVVNHLLNLQSSTGGWSHGSNLPQKLTATCFAIIALRDFENRPDVSKAIRLGEDFLLRSFSENGRWETDSKSDQSDFLVTAMCLCAINLKRLNGDVVKNSISNLISKRNEVLKKQDYGEKIDNTTWIYYLPLWCNRVGVKFGESELTKIAAQALNQVEKQKLFQNGHWVCDYICNRIQCRIEINNSLLGILPESFGNHKNNTGDASTQSLTKELDNICDLGIFLAAENIQTIHHFIKTNHGSALSGMQMEHGKKATTLDTSAEMHCNQFITEYLPSWRFLGEESLRDANLDLSNEQKICVLADVVDGTDLVERGLSNWCSCFVFFDPKKPKSEKILASFVAMPDGEVYYARQDRDGAYLVRFEIRQDSKLNKLKRSVKKLKLPTARQLGSPARCLGVSKKENLADSSICFYGQKINNLEKTITVNFLEKAKKYANSKLRIYNLAGIPMMIKMIQHEFKKTHDMDAVFDAVGQQPHDVVPGAYIAKKAGAVLKHLGKEKFGGKIEISDLEEILLRPTNGRLKYVIAGTEKLAKELLFILR